MKKENLFIVNDSGEILEEIGTDYDRIINNTIIIKPKEPYRQVVKIEYPYVKLNISLPNSFYSDFPQVLLLLPYLEYKTNFLMFPNGRYINQTSFAKATGYSRVYISRLFNKFKKEQIIAPVKLNRRIVYMFNPYIAIMGSYIYTDLMDNFKENKWEKLSKKKGKRYDL